MYRKKLMPSCNNVSEALLWDIPSDMKSKFYIVWHPHCAISRKKFFVLIQDFFIYYFLARKHEMCNTQTVKKYSVFWSRDQISDKNEWMICSSKINAPFWTRDVVSTGILIWEFLHHHAPTTISFLFYLCDIRKFLLCKIE